MSKEEMKVPIWEKEYLTLNEAAALFGIGINKLRDMTDDIAVQKSVVLWSDSPPQHGGLSGQAARGVGLWTKTGRCAIIYAETWTFADRRAS